LGEKFAETWLKMTKIQKPYKPGKHPYSLRYIFEEVFGGTEL